MPARIQPCLRVPPDLAPRNYGCLRPHLRKARPTMTTLFTVLILLLTILAALGLGIMLGYYAVTAILHAMARHSHPVHEPALAASHTSAGGD